MIIAVEVVHSILFNVTFRNLAFPYLFTSKFVFLEDFFHVAHPLRTFILCVELPQEILKLFREIDSLGRFPLIG